jgi:hypothetical protein
MREVTARVRSTFHSEVKPQGSSRKEENLQKALRIERGGAPECGLLAFTMFIASPEKKSSKLSAPPLVVTLSLRR